MPQITPTYNEESTLLDQGYNLIAGLDEVGRGPLAGPVVAGLAILPPNIDGPWLPLVKDSKRMTPTQRQYVLPYLRQAAIVLEIGISSPKEIDELGIVAATQLAMRRALDSTNIQPDFLLLDAFNLPGVPIPQKPIIHGDALCLSIAAASVVAKVTRDNLMEDEGKRFPGYEFAKHKGYPTKEHIQQLKRLGPCSIHRFSFAPVKVWDK